MPISQYLTFLACCCRLSQVTCQLWHQWAGRLLYCTAAHTQGWSPSSSWALPTPSYPTYQPTPAWWNTLACPLLTSPWPSLQGKTFLHPLLVASLQLNMQSVLQQSCPSTAWGPLLHTLLSHLPTDPCWDSLTPSESCMTWLLWSHNQSLTRSFLRSLTRSLTCSLSLTHSFIQSFIHAFVYACMHPIILVSHCVINVVWCCSCRQSAWGQSSVRTPSGPLIPMKEVAAYAMQILEALSHVHSCGILHKGLLPDHILVCACGNISHEQDLHNLPGVLPTMQLTNGCNKAVAIVPPL